MIWTFTRVLSTHSHTHTHTHTHTQTHTPSLSLSQTLSHSHTHTHTFLTQTHTLSPFLSQTYTLYTCPHSHTHALFFSLHFPSLSHTHFLISSLCLKYEYEICLPYFFTVEKWICKWIYIEDLQQLFQTYSRPICNVFVTFKH